MRIRLFRRHYGVHSLLSETKVRVKFSDVVLRPRNPSDDFLIKEDLLLEALPKGFMPSLPETILLTIGDKWGSTAQRKPIFFRAWAKYFDSYVLEISK